MACPPLRRLGAFLYERRAWLAALLVSLFAHGMVLQIFKSRQPLGRPQHTASIQIRSLQATPLIPAPIAPALQAPASAPTPTENTPPSTSGHEVPHTITTTENGQGNAETGAYYFPPEQLSAKPVFLNNDGAPAATFIPDVMPLPVRVQVFINERGDVDQVTLSDNFLSEVAKNLIDASFRAMHFSPGMLGTLPVKSRLGFEVNLDPTLPSQ